MGRNLNVQVDLKVLLAMSMAEGSHHGQWRMQCGNVRYAVHYALLNGLLTIRHLRRRRSSPSRKSRLAKRLRRMKKLKKPAQVTLEHGGTQTVESRVMQQTKGSQTADPVTNQRTKASQTAETMRETKGSQTSEPILSQDTKASQIPESPRMQRAEASQTSQMAMGQMTKCSQTHRMEYRTVDVDTMDLILVYSRYQQTLDPKRKSIGSQGEAPNCNTRSTQVIPHTGDNGNQTTTEFCCTGIQTVRENECVAVQTTADSRSVHTQTLDDGQEEEVLQQPQLDALNIIHHDFQSLTGLIENEMIQSINKLVEITLMEVKALRLAADRPRGEQIEPQQIGDALPQEKADKADKAKAKGKSKRAASGKKHRFGLTFTKRQAKAPHCNMPRHWMTIDCQEYSTQTDDLRELERKVASTQTEKKKRRGWSWH